MIDDDSVNNYNIGIKKFYVQNEKPMDMEMMPSSLGLEQEEQPTFDSSRGFDNPLYDSPPLNVRCFTVKMGLVVESIQIFAFVLFILIILFFTATNHARFC